MAVVCVFVVVWVFSFCVFGWFVYLIVLVYALRLVVLLFSCDLLVALPIYECCLLCLFWWFAVGFFNRLLLSVGGLFDLDDCCFVLFGCYL